MKKKTKAKDNQLNSKTLRDLFWTSLVILIILSVLVGLLVNFLDDLHYTHLLLQADTKASSAQTELGKEQYDVKFLINKSGLQLNCYDLRSNYARNLCFTHEGVRNKAQF